MNKITLVLSTLVSAAAIVAASYSLASSKALEGGLQQPNPYAECINKVIEQHERSGKDINYESVKDFCFFTLVKER